MVRNYENNCTEIRKKSITRVLAWPFVLFLRTFYTTRDLNILPDDIISCHCRRPPVILSESCRPMRNRAVSRCDTYIIFFFAYPSVTIHLPR